MAQERTLQWIEDKICNVLLIYEQYPEPASIFNTMLPYSNTYRLVSICEYCYDMIENTMS